MGVFFTLDGDAMASILGYATDIVGDFMPLLMLLLGIALGFFILKAIFHLK